MYDIDKKLSKPIKPEVNRSKCFKDAEVKITIIKM